MNRFSKLITIFFLLGPCSSSAYELATHARMTQQAHKRSVVVTDASLLSDIGLVGIDLSEPFGKGVFSSMSDRLRRGAVDGELNYLTGSMRTKYADAFSGAKGSLASIVDQLGALVGGRLGENWAYYTVVRNEGGQDVGFPLFMVRGNDGVWRIGEM